MPSEVDICNLALSHLGDSATVASIDPPEGSAQAEHCALWYPIARNALLELYDWNFATARALLAEVVNPFPQWSHAYARPADCLKVQAILPADASGDLAENFSRARMDYAAFGALGTFYTAQDYNTETSADGTQLILTSQPNAMVRYTRLVTDTSKFSPLFSAALTHYLASYLAGPVYKGTTGIQIGQAQMQMAIAMASKAALSSANQRARQQSQAFPWSR